MNTLHARCFAAVSLVSVVSLLCACEDKGTPARSQTTPDNPSTVLGKSAKMARDVAGSVAGQQSTAMSAAEAITGEGNAFTLSGVSIPVPSAWAKAGGGGGSSMAPAAEFSVGGEDGAARLVFFNAGGTADANIARWKGQMKDNGGPAKATVDTKSSAGVKITTIEMEGTYAGMGPGGAPAAPADDTGFLGAIVEGPQGQVQIRMTGPYRTVRAAKPLWTAMINGISTGR